jgi:cation:H+ antiporter
MILTYFLLILGFALLIKGADWLVKGSASLAKKWGISEIIIGLTIVAFGTSTPELVVNSLASSQKLNDMVMGNVIGSNNFNILLILGITALLKPVNVQLSTIKKEIPFSLVAGIVVFLLVQDQFFGREESFLSRLDAMFLGLFFIIFLIYIFRNIKKDKELSVPYTGNKSLISMLVLVIAGLAGLIAGGKLVVDNAIEIANQFGMSERLIGLTIVSVGTSLPELATSAVAAYRGNSDLAIGNVVGSNIFNLLFILGISGLIYPITYDASFNLDIIVYLVATLVLLLSMFTGKKRIIDRWEGLVLIIFYLGYLSFLIINA